jgi:L-ribulose-5-phosphate 4-epimerase
MLDELKKQLWEANVELERSGLVTLTWGNVSGIDRQRGLVVIKPSGVPYAELKPDKFVVLDLDGKVVDGALKPSSDTATHLMLYRSFSDIGGVTHTHSVYATMFAQAGRALPCFGTTHADHFYGTVPVTRMLTEQEVVDDYVGNTGKVIVERFAGMKPMAMPGVLVMGHGPFTWGKDAMDSVKNSIALETIAKMAYGTLLLAPTATAIPQYLLDKHYMRKHGPNAYYGQKK